LQNCMDLHKISVSTNATLWDSTNLID
jgi:hypothetical protein